MKSKVSVITVCFNSEKSIEKTIASVLNLEYRPLQYIIIDGKSTDGTLEIIQKYKSDYEKAGIDFVCVSEEDSGIYNAMNKGVGYAIGEWIIFLNSDDCFYDKNALADVSKYFQDLEVDVLYGNEYVCDKNGHGFINTRNDNIDTIRKTLPFCHQSSLVRKEWLDRHPFDESLRIVADYEFFLFCYMNNARFVYCNSVISAYYKDGLSRIEYKRAIDESFSVKVKYGIIDKRSITARIKKEARKIYTFFQVRFGK